MYTNVLVPTDGSPETEAVIETALSLGSPGETTIHAVYVIDNRALIPLGEDEQESVALALKEKGESAVETVSAAVGDIDPDFEVTTVVAQGIPASQILGYAQAEKIDAIVLGSHGQTMRNQAIGSTAERVVRGVNQIEDTTVVIVPIGSLEQAATQEREQPEGAQDMFQ